MDARSIELLKLVGADATLTPAEREALRRLRRGEVTTPSPAARLLRRTEAAARLSCTPRTVDRWCGLGLLPRVKLPGFARASGIPEASVAGLIASHAAAPVAVHERPAVRAGS
jgi:DNA-binding CsgD family transcriptional regulator